MVSPQKSTNEYLLLGGVKRMKSKSIVIDHLINIITRRTASRTVRKYGNDLRKEIKGNMKNNHWRTLIEGLRILIDDKFT